VVLAASAGRGDSDVPGSAGAGPAPRGHRAAEWGVLGCGGGL